MGVIPSRYPPPVDPAMEFIGAPTDPESERIEVGVAIVGAGPAGLACANRLAQLLEREPELAEMLGEVPVAVIEKGRVPGAHELSGAIMRPSAFARLWPELPEDQWPTYGKVEAVYVMLSARRSLRIPTPPPFKNRGNHIVSIAELTRWMGERAEEARVYILPETSAQRLLVQDGVVRGVRSGDKGRGRSGERLGNFEPAAT
jgi:electron-transferring-flavoprotein dehydrogenase